MEKLKKEKHNHKLTDLLKVVIFSMVMLAPIFSVVSKVMYVSLNKNAYQSWSGTTYKELKPIYYETNNISNSNELYIDHIYYWNDNVDSTTIPTSYTGYFTIYNNYLLSQFNIPSEVEYITFYSANNSVNFVYTYNSNQYYKLLNNLTFNFVVRSVITAPPDYIYNHITASEEKVVKQYIEIEQQETLDTSFEYAINGLKDNELYNWAQDTFAYTSINAMCTGLSIQNGVLPLLLSYWVIITAIYIVFDIIIFTFTKLTHLLQD